MGFEKESDSVVTWTSLKLDPVHRTLIKDVEWLCLLVSVSFHLRMILTVSGN